MPKPTEPPPMFDAENIAMFDYTNEGVKLRDEAIARVDVPWFSQRVCEVVEKFEIGATFTTDDVWDRLTSMFTTPPKEKRAMGAAIMRARKLGLCVPEGYFVPTRRKQAHMSPQRVWRRCGPGTT